jgi:hypothetical protein
LYAVTIILAQLSIDILRSAVVAVVVSVIKGITTRNTTYADREV